MKKIFSAIFILVLGVILATYLLTRDEKKDFSNYQDELWENVVVYRETYNKPSPAKNNGICEFISNIRLKEVSSWPSHEGFKTTDFFSSHGFMHQGENISWDFTTANDAMLGWLYSPTHKAILDDPRYDEGCLRCENNYCVLILATKKSL